MHTLLPTVTLTAEFHCPGEAQPVSPAVHRARLAGGFPACGGCPHNPVAEAAEPPADEIPTLLEGVLLNEIGAGRVRELASRLAQAAWDALPPGAERPSLLLAYDGRPQAAAGMAAAAEAFRAAGCRLLLAGAVTRGAFEWALTRGPCRGLGGLMLGNPTGEEHRIALHTRLPQAASEIAVEEAAIRSGGTVSWCEIGPAWREALRPAFHGLRPLRVQLASASRAVRTALGELSTGTRLRFEYRPARGPAPASLPSAPETNSHLSFWTDGDGAAWRLFDEQGRAVSDHAAFALLHSARRAPTSDTEPTTTHDSVAALAALLAALSTSDAPLSRRLGTVQV